MLLIKNLKTHSQKLAYIWYLFLLWRAAVYSEGKKVTSNRIKLWGKIEWFFCHYLSYLYEIIMSTYNIELNILYNKILVPINECVRLSKKDVNWNRWYDNVSICRLNDFNPLRTKICVILKYLKCIYIYIW